MSLIEKIRKARESVIDVGGRKFTIRRPSEAEQAELYKDPKFSQLEFVRRCVVGWDLEEIDVIPGGNAVALTFNSELWVEYVNDKSELWKPISDAIKAAISAHNAEAERAEKK